MSIPCSGRRSIPGGVGPPQSVGMHATSIDHGVAHDAHPMPSIGRRIARFALHYVEMVLAMIIGMIVLGIPVDTVARAAGYDDLYHELPLAGAIVMTVIMVVPMAAWMGFRGHDRSMTVEMSLAMIVPTVALLAAAIGRLIAPASVMTLVDPLMYVSMLAVMLARWPMYSGAHR